MSRALAAGYDSRGDWAKYALSGSSAVDRYAALDPLPYADASFEMEPHQRIRRALMQP